MRCWPICTGWRLVCLSILYLVGSGGCGSGQGVTSDTAESISSPTTFEESGQTWKLAEMKPQDERPLGAYFQRNASLADNPLINGAPLLYRSSSKATRYYWAESLSGQIHWIRIDFQGGKFIGLEQGEGFPFEQSSL